jgi:SRSO17 transposase
MLGMVSDLGRKNCWTLAERSGHPSPDRLQHLLSRAKWDADGVRDDLRSYVADELGDNAAVLVVDETGDVKKGTATVGVPCAPTVSFLASTTPRTAPASHSA